jgi:hypothetical protein
VLQKADLKETGLAVEAKYRSGAGKIEVEVEVADTTGQDRALQVGFRLPVDLRGWHWGEHLRAAQTIEATGIYHHWFELGPGRFCNVYPFSAVFVVCPSGHVRDRLTAGLRTPRPRDYGLQDHETRNPEWSVVSGQVVSPDRLTAGLRTPAGMGLGVPMDVPRIFRVSCGSADALRGWEKVRTASPCPAREGGRGVRSVARGTDGPLPRPLPAAERGDSSEASPNL